MIILFILINIKMISFVNKHPLIKSLIGQCLYGKTIMVKVNTIIT